MITYHKEKMFDIIEELSPILLEHYHEIAMYRDKIEYAPDWDRYRDLEKTGILKLATVRDDGVLVGYYLTLVVPNLHYSKDLYGVNDIVLIKPKYRNAKVGVGLFNYVEKWMKNLGVSVMSMHMKTFLPFDKLCEGLDWDYAERLYTKCIKE
jgi:GNAT superfamily N-acetyltransferase